MKWAVRIGIGLIVLVGALLLIGPSLISTDGMVAKAETEAKNVLGRDVSIGSVDGLSLLPPRLTITDLTIANAEGFSAPHLVSVGEARIGVAFWPLLSGRVEIETFSLSEPQIFLEARADGSNNYTLGEVAVETKESDSSERAPTAAKALVVGTIVVDNATLSYATEEASYAATDVDAKLVLPPLGAPLTLSASMLLEDIPAGIDMTVEDPWEATATNAVSASISANLADNRFSGSFDAVTEPLTLSGPVSIDLTDIEALAPLVGADGVAAAAPLGTVAIRGRAELTDATAGFREATFTTAIASGTGDFVVATDGPRPKLTGKLAAEAVDLTPFLPEAPAEDSEVADASFPPWSEDDIDVSGLSAADADVEVTAGTVTLPTFSLSDIRASVSVDNGRAVVALNSARAFSGTAQGQAVINARQSTPSLATNFTFSGVQFAEAAPALLGTDRLSGEGMIGFDLLTSGANQKSWVDNLRGTATTDITSGAIIGVDLNAIANSGLSLTAGLRDGTGLATGLGTAFTTLTTQAVAPGSQTAFDLAKMAITISDGLVDLGQGSVSSDTFRATIGGTSNLPEQTMNISMTLAAKAPEAEQYRVLKAPVVVSGSFNAPKIKLDTAPLVQSAVRDQAADLLGSVGVKVDEDQSVGDALRDRAGQELRSLFGGGRKKDDDEDKKDPPR
ncbi:MAG: AsmA family protein [Pseudomonadota bacterium]